MTSHQFGSPPKAPDNNFVALDEKNEICMVHYYNTTREEAWKEFVALCDKRLEGIYP